MSKRNWVFSALVFGAVGCSASPATDEQAASVAQPLPVSWWTSWTTNTAVNANNLSSPTVCGAVANTSPGLSGYIQAGRDLTTNKYVLAMYSKLQPMLNFTVIPSGSITFNSKPVCAGLDGASTSTITNLVAFVGKRSSNDRYYIQLMKLSGGGYLINDPYHTPSPPPMPTVQMAWSQISTDTYASAPFVHVFEQNYMVVGGRRSDNLIYIHVNPFQWNATTQTYDYNNSFWEAPLAAPALPSGWTAIGDPTINHWGPNMSGEVRIVTRAQNGTQLKLFTLWMFVPWRWVGSEWFEVPAGPSPPDGDPAQSYERRFREYQDDDWPDDYAATLFYKGADNKIYQASITGSNTLTEPFGAIQNTNGFIGAPAAVGSIGLDGGSILAARKITPAKQYYTSNLPTIF